MLAVVMSIQKNLKIIEERICAACEKAGRSRDDVKLVAVSKRKPAEAVIEAAEAGQILFGENRVQEAQTKIPMCPPRHGPHVGVETIHPAPIKISKRPSCIA